MTTTTRLGLVLVWLCAGLAATQPVHADGRNYRLSTDELAIRISGEWAGGGQGGYYPLRIRVVNTGPSRQLTFRFRPDPRHPSPRVERTIQADQNATARFSLSIPLVGRGDAGVLEVADENGKLIGDLQQPIRFPPVDAGYPAPAILIISEGRVVSGALGRAAVRLATVQGDGGYVHVPGLRYGGREASVEGTHVAPADLPTAWRDYTCVDLAFVDLVTLGRLTEARRKALLKWVQCGGTLIVYNVGGAPASSNELQTLLELDAGAPASGMWRSAEVRLQGQSAALLSRSAGVEAMLGPRRRGFPRIRRRRIEDRVLYRWQALNNEFYNRDLLFGRIVAFSGDPFQGTEYDWAWFLTSVGPERYRWSARHGLSARRASPSFHEFLIPGITGVPVYSFLFLITAFTVLIGPVNYVLLWKRKRLFLLVMTIPVIAFGTSLTLFGYSVVSNGFNVKTRVRSLTILDQRSKDAVSMSRVAMFSGLTPSGGLRFRNETAVFPLWPYEREFEAGAVDWTDGQKLTSGWLRSRTRTQFLTVTHRRERGRLQIGETQAETLPVSNGFEWNISAVLVSDRNGRIYFGKALRPGDSAKLVSAAGPELKQIDALLRRFPLDFDDKPTTTARSARGMFGFRRRQPGRSDYSIRFSNNLMERRIAEFRMIRQKGFQLPPGSYLAVFETSPGLDLGVDDPKEHAAYHLLLGYY
ncbi:MAG: hypothetical protein ACE5KM_07920 [Planctomycetaceae bacterium]